MWPGSHAASIELGWQQGVRSSLAQKSQTRFKAAALWPKVGKIAQSIFLPGTLCEPGLFASKRWPSSTRAKSRGLRINMGSALLCLQDKNPHDCHGSRKLVVCQIATHKSRQPHMACARWCSATAALMCPSVDAQRQRKLWPGLLDFRSAGWVQRLCTASLALQLPMPCQRPPLHF